MSISDAIAPLVRSGLAAACAALSACAAATESRSGQAQNHNVGDPVAGRALVSDLCSACHAVSAQDESPNERAPPLRTVLSRYDAEQLADVLQRGELMGRPDLPHAYLSEQGARDTVAYLIELNTSER